MPVKGSHLWAATAADGPRLRGQRRLGHAVRVMREARGWTQSQLVRRILIAEGVDPEKAKTVTNNMRVSRIENGQPITLRNLTGFALAFGYRTVIDWLADVFAADGETISADERAVLEGYRTATEEGKRLIQVLTQTLRSTPPPSNGATPPSARRRRGR